MSAVWLANDDLEGVTRVQDRTLPIVKAKRRNKGRNSWPPQWSGQELLPFVIRYIVLTHNEVPADLKSALTDSPQVHKLWMDITPMARWDWIRWIRATKQPETRKRRIEVACSKLKAGTRRPCCFNRNLCTEPSVSNNGMLLEPREL